MKTAEKGEIYATVALTQLSAKNNWYTFYKGSKVNQPIPSETAALSLDVGDAVVWRGDLIYFHSPGGRAGLGVVRVVYTKLHALLPGLGQRLVSGTCVQSRLTLSSFIEH